MLPRKQDAVPEGSIGRLPLPGLALVTDRRLCGHDSLLSVVNMAVAGGVNLIQLRERDLPAGELLALAQLLKKAIAGRALLFVNDRVDVALACAAHGVQLGEKALPVPVVRRLVGDKLLIGRSVHSVSGALQAVAEGADFLVAGTIFASPTHPEESPAGVGLLTAIVGEVRLPCLAIGGVNASNVREVMAAGAAGVAVITAILAAPDPKRAAQELREAMDSVWAHRKLEGQP